MGNAEGAETRAKRNVVGALNEKHEEMIRIDMDTGGPWQENMVVADKTPELTTRGSVAKLMGVGTVY